MFEEITVRGNIYGISIPVVKEICHDLFQDTDLITLRIKRQERSLFLICKVVKPRKIQEDGFLQEFFYLSSVKIILIEAGPDILIFRCSFQVGCYLGDIGKLNDFFQLLICHEPALHGADLG